MKRLFLALALCFTPSLAFAQCTGVFPPNTLCGNNTGSAKVPGAISSSTSITGPGTSAVGDLALWNNLTGSLLKAQTPGAFTRTNDTNVTITLGGSSSTAMVNAMSVTMGWAGTLAAARLNANVVQAITNDTNITGSITAQNLTLGWTGTLDPTRLNANVVQSFVNDTNVTASIAAQIATLGWSGQLAIARGGTGASTQSTAASAILPTPVAPGDILYWNGSAWTTLPGNGSGTQLLSENSSGVPAWTTVSGTGTVTSITQGAGLTFSATPCTSSCTIGITTPITVSLGGTGNATAAQHTIPLNQGTSAQTNTGTGTIGQAVISNGAAGDPAFTSGPWVLLATLTCPNSGSDKCLDITHLTSTYNDYHITFENIIPATNSVTLELQAHSGGTYQSTTYTGASLGTASGATSIQNPTTFIQLSGGSSQVLNTTISGGVTGYIEVMVPSNTTYYKAWYGQSTHDSSGVFFNNTFSGAWRGGAGAVDGFQFLFSSGNMSSGTIKIYGRL